MNKGKGKGENTLRKFWDKISSFGIREDFNDNLKRNVILSNQVGAVLLGLSIITSVLVFFSLPFNFLVGFWFSFLILMLVLFLALSASGKINASRLLLTTVIQLVILGATVHTRVLFPEVVHQGSYYIPRYYMVGMTMIPVLVFSFDEKRNLFSSLAFNVFLIFLYNPIHHFFNVAPADMGMAIKDESFISISAGTAALVVVAGSIFLIRINSIYEKRVRGLLHETSEKNKEIEASIRYAQRLQNTILPNEEDLKELKDRLFVVFKPKDIVSGDFYKIYDLGKKKIIAVVDCTGHGVPGAFVSMIASTSLRNAIEEMELTQPDEILAKVNELICEEFERDSTNDIQDGMDLSLCLVDTESEKVLFAGANQRLYQVSGDEVNEFRGDRGSLGKEDPNKRFELHEIPCKKGDYIFMTSDGYPDQFGGPKDKKFGRKRLRETFVSASKMPLAEGEKFVSITIDNWIGAGEQTDDICVMAYQV